MRLRSTPPPASCCGCIVSRKGARAQRSSRRLSGRGVGYWTDGKNDERVFYVTIGYQLVGLDAKTGNPLKDFGVNGVIDLKKDADQVLDPVEGEIAWNGAPVVAKNVVLVGAAHRAGTTPRSRANAKGFIRAYDARTGKRLWIFHTIPIPGEFGNDTWLEKSWEYTGNTGVWTQMTVDEQLGIAYLPVEIPTGDYYGGHRPGNNLFSESLVAVDLQTGKRIWHYQFVHHPIWDYDVPCAPILVDITVDGRRIAAVAQPTKQGFIFVFDRKTGEPVWPIEERAVEKGTVPREWYSPTQPFPTKPPSVERQGFLPEYVIDFTPALKAEALALIAKYKIGPIYTPPIVRGEGGKNGLLFIPNGPNWPGGSFDPETGMLYIYSHTLVRVLSMVNDPKRSDMNYISDGGASEGGGGDLSVQGLPLIKPPYGRISAVDLNKGEIVWQIAHGETPDNIKNHPALKGLDRSAHGAAWRRGRQLRRHRHAGHEDAVDLGRRRHGEDAGWIAGRHAPRLRQEDRRRSRRGGHARRADRFADDLHARRQTVHRGGVEQLDQTGRTHRLQTAVKELTEEGKVARIRRIIWFSSVLLFFCEMTGSRVTALDRYADIDITTFTHSHIQFEHAGKVIHVDPWSVSDLSKAKPADLILITDDVGHHLDAKAIARVRKPGAPVVIAASGKTVVPDGIVMGNGETREVAGVRIEATPAYDVTPGESFHPKGEANGYLLTLGGRRIYVVGVTECVPEIRSAKNVDVAFFPMNLPAARMEPDAAIGCIKAMNPKVVYPYHYDQAWVRPVPAGGTRPAPTTRGLQELVKALTPLKIEVRLANWYP